VWDNANCHPFNHLGGVLMIIISQHLKIVLYSGFFFHKWFSYSSTRTLPKVVRAVCYQTRKGRLWRHFTATLFAEQFTAIGTSI
jgi:hypothetical protein